MTKNIFVTGGTGFIGKQLVQYLLDQGYCVNAPARSETGDLDNKTNWSKHLENIDTVIHLAGRAHVMQENADDPLALYRAVNSSGTENLARQALDAGVKRFIFASSVKVMGESAKQAFSVKDTPAPIDPYGQSKLEGEQALSKISPKMDIVILRLPLVYGPGVKGNFINLLKLLQKGLPLPFGLIKNKRSMIYSGNLVSAVEASLTVKPGIYFPSDQDDLSTTELSKTLALALNYKTIFLPLPVFVLKLLGKLSGKTAMIQRLTDSLIVDGELGEWIPPFSAKEGLIQTALWFKNLRTNR